MRGKPPDIPVTKLFVGRKRQSVDGPIRLEVVPTLTNVYADDPEVKVVTEQTYRVFVGDKLFAQVTVYPKRSGRHAPIRLSKDLASGEVTLKLVKRYTELKGA